jgi:hypothetical protein
MELKNGAQLIKDERNRQVSGEGFDAARDDGYSKGELARWKPKNRLRNLARAGALYQAEIERLERAVKRIEERIDEELSALKL